MLRGSGVRVGIRRRSCDISLKRLDEHFRIAYREIVVLRHKVESVDTVSRKSSPNNRARIESEIPCIYSLPSTSQNFLL